MTKVLVVDDEQDGADGLAMFFESLGYKTATAFNGVEALEIASAFEPDVVILDIEMPLMDGFQAARQFRQRRGTDAPYLVAITALVGEDVATRAKECGFDAYLAKPADLAKLRNLIEQSQLSLGQQALDVE